MNPKIRFAITMSFLITSFWLWGILDTYLFGEKGLNVGLFIQGVFKVGFASAFGFAFVSLCVKFITFQKHKKTAFEADTIDEYGTTFNWPIMLSKFVPEVIAPPLNSPITRTEQELIGFLNGYATWPQDIYHPEQGNLKDVSINRWRAVAALHNTTELHRITALAIDLGKVVSYQEKREVAPITKPWRQDKVTYKLKAAEHGSFSAFILSTFESFRKLPQDQRQTILLAVRFGRDPQRIPSNAAPVVREIYTAVNRAESKILLGEEGTAPPEALTLLEREITTYTQGILTRIPLLNDTPEAPEGVYVGGKQALLVVTLKSIAEKVAEILPPQTRHALNLWDVTKGLPTATPIIIDRLRAMDLVVDDWEGEAGDQGIFSFSFAGKTHPQCVILTCTPDKTPMLFKKLSKLPKSPSLPEPALDDSSLLADIKSKAMSIDTLLQG